MDPMVDACPVIEPVAEPVVWVVGPIVWVAVLIRLHSFNVIVVFTCGNNNPGYGLKIYCGGSGIAVTAGIN